jgi:DNA repair exonuclease SbcCD ATPase subunit
MTRTARVTSIETVSDFRAHLVEFGTKARDTLSAIEMQIRRTIDWLGERQKYWHHEIKVRQEELTRAKIELEQRKNMGKDGRGPGTADHEKNLRKAQARLKEAEDKVQSCKRWLPLLEHAVREYHGPARGLSGALDADLVQALALLERKLTALESYLALAPPSVGEPILGGAPDQEVSTGVATPLANPMATAESLPPPEEADSLGYRAPEPPADDQV